MNEAQGSNSLLTKTSLSVSLAPPRASPVGTAQHAVLVGRHPPKDDLSITLAHGNDEEEAHSYQSHHTIHQRLFGQLSRAHGLHPRRRPHPHAPTTLEIRDQITRLLGILLPLQRQNQWRDSGGFRSLSDRLVLLMAPSMALSSPRSSLQFVQLTRLMQTVPYGKHERQSIDLFRPDKRLVVNESSKAMDRLIVFMHGGAWGSGYAWMYRLIAGPFLEQGYSVAIPNYRVYPDGCIGEQTQDLEDALLCLDHFFPESKYRKTIVGHSSGAHVSLLSLVASIPKIFNTDEVQLSPLRSVDSYIGISGPYDIAHHFDFEANRGVEEISPMKPVNGYTREAFRRNSPGQLLQRLHSEQENFPYVRESDLVATLPQRILLIHGMEDTTVPFTATSEMARILRCNGVCADSTGQERRDVDEVYIAHAGHTETVMQLMLGGQTRQVVLEWLGLFDCLHETHARAREIGFVASRDKVGNHPSRLVISSKL